MSFLKKALTSAAAAKAIDIARREAAKPENQQKAKDLMAQISKRVGRGGSGRVSGG